MEWLIVIVYNVVFIVLTVIAWRRGWGAFALIPWGVSFILRIWIAIAGGPFESLAMDVTLFLALTLLAVFKRKAQEPVAEKDEQAPGQEEAKQGRPT